MSQKNVVPNVNPVDDINIIEHTIDLMHEAELMRHADGEMKKVFVLTSIRLILGNVTYERYYPLINIIIDTLVSISRKEIILELQTLKKSCLPLFSSCK